MRVNGDAIYGSRAWAIPGEGQLVDGKLRMLPGGKLGQTHADFAFGPQDFRFVVGRDGALYAFTLAVPAAGATVKINSLGADAKLLHSRITAVSLLGYSSTLRWEQKADSLEITYPSDVAAKTAVVFRVASATPVSAAAPRADSGRALDGVDGPP